MKHLHTNELWPINYIESYTKTRLKVDSTIVTSWLPRLRESVVVMVVSFTYRIKRKKKTTG